MPSLQRYVFRGAMWYATRQMRKDISIEQMRGQSAQSEGVLKAPKDALLTPVDVGGMPAKWIAAPGAADGAVILYLHGGGFVLGYTSVYDHFLYYVSQATKLRVLAIDYRLAPEQPFPAALDDGVAAYRSLLQQGYAPGQIIIAGDSAGGNLTLATLLDLRNAGDPLPAGGIALSPATDSTLSGTSMTSRERVESVLSRPFIERVAAMYAGTADRRNPRLSPLFADPHGLPPLLIQVGDQEMLLSDAQRFAENASAAGVAVKLTVWPKLWHVFQLCAPWLPEARQAIAEMTVFVQDQLATPTKTT